MFVLELCDHRSFRIFPDTIVGTEGGAPSCRAREQEDWCAVRHWGHCSFYGGKDREQVWGDGPRGHNVFSPFAFEVRKSP